jgi:chromosome segregation ATPase
MNNITLAHIGSELVIIGGIAFYFHRKTNMLQTELENLKMENKNLTELVNDMQENLQQLGNVVMHLQQQLHNQSVPHRNRSTKQTSVQLPPLEQVNKHPLVDNRKRNSGLHRRRPVKKHSDDSGSETLDDTELDKELESEYDKLQKERRVHAVDDCEGDVCSLEKPE